MKKLIALLLLAQIGFAQIQKVEPPFWYSGMKKTELQLMLYGKNIGNSVVSCDKATVVGVIRTENPNYLFVNLDLKNVPAGSLELSLTQGKKVEKRTYELRARRKDSANRKGFDSSDVMYLLMPDRFANGNPNNDSTSDTADKFNRSSQDGRHGGDIAGMKKHLDYLEDLGVTAVWSTPLCEDNDPKTSYHGYAQSDVYRIDPRYGSNEEYVDFVEAAHQKGIKVVKDYVTNHWGTEHWLLKDLPTYKWVHQFPGYGQTNYRMTTQFDVNASKIDSRYCMDGWFVRSMPDLDQTNELVLNYLTQNALWWIEYANLDGFRVDTYSYADKHAIAKWTKAIMDEYPNFNIVGEVWMYDQAQMAYWQKDSKIGAIQSYNSYLPSVMDFTLQGELGSALKEEESNWTNGLIKVYNNFTNDFLYPNTDNLLVFFENHDTQRFNHIYNGNFAKYKMALAIIATVRGIPQIYYGSEIGMQGNKDKGDGDIRRDFPGGWSGDTNNAFTLAGRTAEQNQFHEFTKKVFNYRKNNPVLHFGKMKHYLPINNVYVYFRTLNEKSVMVVVNNNKEAQTLDLTTYNESLAGYRTGQEIVTGSKLEINKSLSVPAQDVLIIELQK
ncbi:glycoside hydrolase family 13 protein [Flavobacterium aurantiibacter]|uniref:Alpha-amlyase n=1 Tax=Flavobacterium aurantiibacter TaxID=2023067 RepID=A0A255ZL75_9FLAO|nr:glycoside hydrolase family 13 protein [Flavobacterium aurantiibacter]OYQ42248.1 alpha-amlyase [Flavobacterium aurantiibacter]